MAITKGDCIICGQEDVVMFDNGKCYHCQSIENLENRVKNLEDELKIKNARYK